MILRFTVKTLFKPIHFTVYMKASQIMPYFMIFIQSSSRFREMYILINHW